MFAIARDRRDRDGWFGTLLIQFLPFAMILAIFYFLILLPMKRRQKQDSGFSEWLKVGTTS